MRVLVCLSSLVRDSAFEWFAESFRRRIVERLPARPDLIGHFPALTPRQADRLRALADESWLEVADDPQLDRRLLRMTSGMVDQRHGIRGNLLQWHSLKQCEALKRSVESQRGLYDLVLWTRPDLYFLSDLDPEIVPGQLYVPAHCSWSGYNDRFCFGPSGLMSGRMSIYDYFVGTWYPRWRWRRRQRLFRFRDAQLMSWNAECVLRDLVHEQLRVVPRRTRVVSARLRGNELVPPIRHEQWGDPPLDDPAIQEVFERLARIPQEQRRLVPDSPAAIHVPLETVEQMFNRVGARQRGGAQDAGS
jgi:hypothetical protein